jgi:hexosaminidase
MAVRFFLAFLFLSILISCNSESKRPEIPIDFGRVGHIALIPLPQTLDLDSGWFVINSETVIYCDPFSIKEAAYFQKALARSGVNLTIKQLGEPDEPPTHPNRIVLLSGEGLAVNPGDEYYDLQITSSNIELMGITSTGVFRGIQTIFQLLVPEFHKGEIAQNWYVPGVQISDAPQFAHRGMLMDVCRHFYNVEVVKKYIDLLALYKMNVLHWHLTEDQGWRIQIDAFPKLTEIGAWRTEADGTRYGGFYSKEDIREIVAYAAERHITVIPEIEMPGHSQAALAAYPHLGCTGQPVEVANDWGVFKEIYCAGKDSTFGFINTVLGEVMELFPSKFIHIGGDEAPKFRWENCARCQKRMKDEGLKDEHELQSYFIQRVEKYLNEHGRQLIGWDEILEGGLAPGATVQSWRGMDGGIAAVTSGHRAIMSPTSHSYFDYPLSNIDLERVYGFDPIPPGLTEEQQKLILGGECNLWSEHIPDEATLDAQTFPRLLAMAEVLWSYPSNRNFNEFQSRVEQHYPILEARDVKFGAETVPFALKTEYSSGKLNFLLEVKQRGADLFWNESGADKFNLYSQSVEVKTGGVKKFKIQARKGDFDMGAPVQFLLQNHLALGGAVSYSKPYSSYYPAAGDFGLVDGLLGSENFRDGQWQGFSGIDAEVVIDLGKEMMLKSLSTNAYQYNNAWIMLPLWVEFSVSADGKKFQSVGKVTAPGKPEERGQFISAYEVEFQSIKARYIKVLAKNFGQLPQWHEAAGADAWVFIDEIVAE